METASTMHSSREESCQPSPTAPVEARPATQPALHVTPPNLAMAPMVGPDGMPLPNLLGGLEPLTLTDHLCTSFGPFVALDLAEKCGLVDDVTRSTRLTLVPGSSFGQTNSAISQWQRLCEDRQFC